MPSKESTLKRKSSSGGGGGGGSHHHKSNKKAKPAVVEKEGSSSSQQKRALKKERQSHRKHADVVEEAKRLWNSLRVKTNTPDDITKLMDQVMTLIVGKIPEISLQHDASRVVQAAIQFGSTEQRQVILDELIAPSDKNDSSNNNNTSLPELAKIQYAHFLVLKLIKYCARDDKAVKKIVKVCFCV